MLTNTLLELLGVALLAVAAAVLVSPWLAVAVVGLYLIYVAREVG